MKLSTAMSKNLKFDSLKADLLAIGVHDLKEAKSLVGSAIIDKAQLEGFDSKEGSVFYTHLFAKTGPKAVAIIGMGEKSKSTPDVFRKTAARAFKIAESKKMPKLGLLIDSKAYAKEAAEGLVLASYRFDKYLTEKKDRYVKEVTVYTDEAQSKSLLQTGEILAEATLFARDLINECPSVMNPEAMAKVAQKQAKSSGLQVEILNDKQLEKEKFGLLLAVGRGSSDVAPPRVIRLAYRPSKKFSKHLVFVGKGVTFDSGGLDIKPSDGMLHMKTDMAGSAAVLGAICAIGKLKPNVAVTAYLGCVENGVDSKSYHPGDILISRKGLTVEVNNTDAEGRLVLADTMNYAQGRDKPDVLIDVATLTGACMVALGPNTAGLFSNNDSLAANLKAASEKSSESFWRMPLEDALFEQLKTPIADMKNTGERYGGAITAALFLQKFVEESVAWAHLDIAGPGRNDKDQPYTSVGGSGFGVRTLVELALAY